MPTRREFDSHSPLFKKIKEKINKLEQKLEKDINIKNRNSLKSLEKLYKHMNKIESIIKPFTPCNIRCSNCCKIDVSVSYLEIHLIEKYLLEKKINVITRKIDNISSIFSKEKEGKVIGYMCSGKDCPFLENEKCIIYEVRPYYCREFMVFEDNNEKCGYNDKETRQLNQFLKRELYDNIITQNRNITEKNQISFEIRDCFVKQK
ncbi:MAG: YkgJ family cysteine cluster protein [Treponema sp.]|nr:YkgJ family cysteine cluster protein [Treponema sp.]